MRRPIVERLDVRSFAGRVSPRLEAGGSAGDA
jgi:hypothetical protein